MLKIKEVFKKIRSFLRRVHLFKGIKILKGENPTIICQNCYAGIFLHDYNLKFMSPTINMYFSVPDFIEFCNNLETYIKMPMKEVKSKDCNYPLGKVDKILIHLVHYSTFEEANIKWIERCERVNLNNLYFMMTDRDGCTYEDLLEFDRLKCKNKVVFVHKPCPGIKSACYVQGYENEDFIGNIYSWKGLFGKRIWDDYNFNFVNFIKRKS